MSLNEKLKLENIKIKPNYFEFFFAYIIAKMSTLNITLAKASRDAWPWPKCPWPKRSWLKRPWPKCPWLKRPWPKRSWAKGPSTHH